MMDILEKWEILHFLDRYYLYVALLMVKFEQKSLNYLIEMIEIRLRLCLKE